jgi:lysophospholipid acyltransferase (LPLAT)-like uncharacterized protein
MNGAARYPVWLEPAAALGAGLLRALGATWTIERTGNDPSDPRGASREPAIFAFWHAQLLPLVYSHRDRDAAVLVSQSRDGELITRVLERLGYCAARGSSTRGGDEGLRGLLAYAAAGHHVAVTPDGPRGPAEVVKPGVIYLAARSGLPVIPVAVAFRPARRLRSWDALRVPLPLARVRIELGDAQRVSAGADQAEQESARARLEAELKRLTTRVRERAGEPQ